MPCGYEHDRGRNLIAAAANALDGYSAGEDAQTAILIEDLAAYTSLLRHHIHTEDHTFYPMAEEVLSKAEQENLLREFNEEESKLAETLFEDSRRLVVKMGALLSSPLAV